MYEPTIAPSVPSHGATFFRCGKQVDFKSGKIAVKHHFNHQLCMVIPGVVSHSSITNCLNELEYYYVRNVTPLQLLNKDFVDAFGNAGVLYAMSINTWLDRDDCLCIYPKEKNSWFTLILNRFTAQRLPHFALKPHPLYKDKRVLTLKMTTPQDNDAWMKKMEALKDLKFDLVVSWTPAESSVDPRSVAAYLESQGCIVSICTPQVSAETSDKPCNVPKVADVLRQTKEQSGKILEWLGAAEIGALQEDDSYCEHPRQRVPTLTIIRATGFFPGLTLIPILDSLRSLCDRHSPPFTSISIHGFVDSPILWDDHLNVCGHNSSVLMWTSQNTLGWWTHNTSKTITPPL